jgi:hypothetical protein
MMANPAIGMGLYSEDSHREVLSLLPTGRPSGWAQSYTAPSTSARTRGCAETQTAKASSMPSMTVPVDAAWTSDVPGTSSALRVPEAERSAVRPRPPTRAVSNHRKPIGYRHVTEGM